MDASVRHVDRQPGNRIRHSRERIYCKIARARRAKHAVHEVIRAVRRRTAALNCYMVGIRIIRVLKGIELYCQTAWDTTGGRRTASVSGIVTVSEAATVRTPSVRVQGG